jgi:hypothetical protein
MAVTKGVPNAHSSLGDQVSAHFVWVQPGRLGGGAVSVTQSNAGDRRVLGALADTCIGKIAWLGEADPVRDAGLPRSARDPATLLGCVGWRDDDGIPHNGLRNRSLLRI